MKVKKTQASKKANSNTINTPADTQNKTVIDDLAQKDQIIQRLEKELLACQNYKENLNQKLLNYQQQPITTLIAYYQNEWHNYYLNRILLPLNQHYEHLLSNTLKLIAETQNLLQTKVQASQQWLLQIKQQGLTYLQQAKDLLVQLSTNLKAQQKHLVNTSIARVTALHKTLLSFIQTLKEKLSSFAPKLATNAFTTQQTNPS